MSQVLCDLMSDLTASPALACSIAGKDEFWFRANDRFDVCKLGGRRTMRAAHVTAARARRMACTHRPRF
jgi:hypothetical protein